MSKSVASDYDLIPDQCKELQGAVLLPHDLRIEVLAKYFQRNGWEKTLNLFSQFIGLANSVVENHREWLEVFLITDCNVHPETVQKINTPSLSGALNGISLAASVNQNKTCEGCAFRKGTVANQCLSTTLDCQYTIEERSKFMCHMDLDDRMDPTHVCAGFAQAIKNQRS